VTHLLFSSHSLCIALKKIVVLSCALTAAVLHDPLHATAHSKIIVRRFDRLPKIAGQC